MQTDNGAEFGQAFHWHLLDKGIDYVKIRPRTPRLNGKVERSQRIDSDEFYRLLEGLVLDDTRLFAERLQQWEDHYNYDRPRGALGRQTPSERLKQKAAAPLSSASGSCIPKPGKSGASRGHILDTSGADSTDGR